MFECSYKPKKCFGLSILSTPKETNEKKQANKIKDLDVQINFLVVYPYHKKPRIK
jgi:hypothetical protein